MSNLLRLVNPEAVHSDTKLVRYTDLRVCDWFPTTQAWAWKGGDALVVVTGHCPRVQDYTVIRTGDKVQVIPGSLAQAMAVLGMDVKDFDIL